MDYFIALIKSISFACQTLLVRRNSRLLNHFKSFITLVNTLENSMPYSIIRCASIEFMKTKVYIYGTQNLGHRCYISPPLFKILSSKFLCLHYEIDTNSLVPSFLCYHICLQSYWQSITPRANWMNTVVSVYHLCLFYK